jgi:hypothetical protein
MQLAEVLVRHSAEREMPDRDGVTPEPEADTADAPESATVAPEQAAGPAMAPIEPAPRRTAETILDWDAGPAFPEQAPPMTMHGGRWLLLAAVATLVLGLQVVHYARDTLAIDPRVGPVLRAAYGRIGIPLYPAWPLDSYEIRGAKAIAENSAPGALDIVAEIAVTGPQPVGPPMVRVMLRDRWSNAVASGVFDAASYIAEAEVASDVYAPGSLIPVQISLKDPGASAQGYELDVCMPNRRLGLLCRNGRDPFRR